MRRACDDFAALVKRKDFTRWLDAPENRRRLSDLDRDFHTTLLAAAGNGVAQRFFENAQVLSLVVSWNFLQADSATLAARAVATAQQHGEIYEAIRKRDPKRAARLMLAHVSGMKARVLDAIQRP
jgi:DNA-binding GntR family transcriptional regulator